MTLLELLEGPLWIASASIFVVFAAFRLIVILFTGRREAEARPAGSPFLGALRTILGHFLPWRRLLGNGKAWFVTIAGYSFHIGLFVLLLFAAPHVEFIREKIVNLPWDPIPRWGFILSAQFAFAGLITLWVRRFVDPVVRLISRPDDHVAAGLTFIVMLTGCMALGEQSAFLRGLHLGLVELWLIYFPFSSLMHTFTWPFSRGFTGAMAGRRGTRA